MSATLRGATAAPLCRAGISLCFAMLYTLRMASAPLCALCAAPVRPPYRAPQAELAPDLDMRPGEPTRSTLSHWIQTCGHCGACAPDLTRINPAAAGVLNTPAYRSPNGPREAAGFLRWSLICQHTGDIAEAAEAQLQAAWAADDAAAPAFAAACRAEAVRLWGDPADPQTRLRLIDMLRRAGDFAGAQQRVAALREGATLDEGSERVLAFEAARIAAGDAGRHLISSALRPPAHSPHVAHGRRPTGGPGGGLWRRLFGSRP